MLFTGTCCLPLHTSWQVFGGCKHKGIIIFKIYSDTESTASSLRESRRMSTVLGLLADSQSLSCADIHSVKEGSLILLRVAVDLVHDWPAPRQKWHGRQKLLITWARKKGGRRGAGDKKAHPSPAPSDARQPGPAL